MKSVKNYGATRGLFFNTDITLSEVADLVGDILKILSGEDGIQVERACDYTDVRRNYSINCHPRSRLFEVCAARSSDLEYYLTAYAATPAERFLLACGLKVIASEKFDLPKLI
jgi:hypothetical protein